MAFRIPQIPEDRFGEDQENQEGRASMASSRGTSMPASKRVPTSMSTSTRLQGSASTTSAAGAVSEDDFRKAFTQVPKSDIHDVRELQQQMESVKLILENTNQDWSKRVNSLKLLRSIVLNGGMDFQNELVTLVLSMEDALLTSIKDLRSQVCREACISVSLLCEKLDIRIVRLCEVLLPAAISLIQTSVKVMATSAALVSIFIIKNVEHPKLIPLVIANCTSKSKEIRKYTHELINQMLNIWTPAKLEKSMPGLVEAIKTGICDADPQARQAARNSYQQLEMHFPKQAQFLYQSLDPARQRTLCGGATSAASSSQSISSERDSLHMNHRPGAFGLSRPKAFYSGRSASEIDPMSVRRAANSTPQKGRLVPINSINRSPQIRATPTRGLPPSSIRQTPTPFKSNSANNPPASVSQPGSRSSSPTRIGGTARRTQVPARITAPTVRSPVQRDSSPRRLSGSTIGRGGNGYTNGAADHRDLFNAIKNFSISNEDDDFLLGGGVLKFDQAELTDALRGCSSANVSEKKEGLRALQGILNKGRQLSPPEVKKVSDTINKMLTEGNHKLMSNVLDALSDFVRVYHNSLSDWLQLLLMRLLTKSGTEILPTVQSQLSQALSAVRHAFRPEQQLMAICKYIQDPIHTPQVKVKGATLLYLHELLSSMDPGTELNRSEFRGAINKIFQWTEDPKNQSVKPACERVLFDLFSLNTADFSSILATFPPEWKEYAFSLLKKNGNSDSGPPTVRENISEMSAQISDYVDSRNHLPSLGGLGSSPNKVNGSSRHSSTPSEGDLSGLSDMCRAQLDNTMALGEDPTAQHNYIAGLLKELSVLDASRRSEQYAALLTLHQMVGEGSFTTWDENFKPVLLHIFEVIKVQDPGLKKHALKLLHKITLAQAARLYDMAEMTIFKVLDCITEEENVQVLHVADECLKTLATHLPQHVVIRALNPIISHMNDARVAPSLKMLTRLVESMEHDDLLSIVPDIAPGVIGGYESSSSSVRKCTVFCLVAMVNKLGREPLNVYLDTLHHGKMRLLEVYIQRAQTSSTTF